ncbi:MAG: ferredoxin III, nif-specific [Betaproteobacteria bacterium HGW-Betaproteobacteria-7]|jgi:Nif-specific ferredoxin III|nr:MAG: ferredoxin III, nif-specific [Betaproteobacteria bacterium HGW-Betaproteobacteria-7]
MADYTALTRGGTTWIPQFVTGLSQEKCIGCGRCYKVCPRDVLNLIDSDEDEDEDESAAAKMTLKDLDDCIGCSACGRVCPKSCFSYAPLAA